MVHICSKCAHICTAIYKAKILYYPHNIHVIRVASKATFGRMVLITHTNLSIEIINYVHEFYNILYYNSTSLYL